MKKKSLVNQLLSFALCVVMVLSMTPLAVITAFAAESSDTTYTVQKLEGSTSGKILSSGSYYLGSDVSFTNPNGSGLTIAENAKVVIDVNGYTLTATGADATTGSDGRGGGAGIHLPESATLIFIGSGTVNAYGGRAASGGDGQNGGAASFQWGTQNGKTYSGILYVGAGGAGGDGGGGGGAGIGTPGGLGGDGGAANPAVGTSMYGQKTDANTARPGNNGTDGQTAAKMGTLYVLGSVNINANTQGGQGNGGDNGNRVLEAVATSIRYDGSLSLGDWYVQTASAGGSGGGGGGGGVAKAIGTGGAGGGGGGGGSTGAFHGGKYENIAVENNLTGNDIAHTDEAHYFNQGNGGLGGDGAGDLNSDGQRGDFDNQYYIDYVDHYICWGEGDYKVGPVYTVYYYGVTERYLQSGTGGASGARSSQGSYSSYLNSDEYKLNVTLVDENDERTAVATIGSDAALVGTPHRKTGYTVGYYTEATGGTKILDSNLNIVADTVEGYTVNGKWNTAANTRLYVQWESCSHSWQDGKCTECGDVIMPIFKIEDKDLFVSYDDGANYEKIGNVADGNGIEEIKKTATNGNIDTYTIYYTDGYSTTFTVTNGTNGADGKDGVTPQFKVENSVLYVSYDDGTSWTSLGSVKGDKGDTGNGVASIEKTKTEGNVDTYTITYTDGATTTFTVTNGNDGIDGIDGTDGKDGHSPVITIQNGYWYIDNANTNIRAEGLKGDTGNGISAIEKTGTNGLVDTYTITFTDGSTTSFTVTNGADGTDGAAGVGIEKVEKAGSEGNVDTYTITLTNGNTFTFTVTNGSSGSNGTNGKDGITPQLRINESTNMWEVSYDNGKTWTSLGVKATGENGKDGKDGTDGKDGANGKDGADGKDGTDGKDGLNPFIGENGNWWIGDTDTGVQAAYDGSVPVGSGSVVENNGMNTATLLAIIIACLALASNIVLVILYVNQKKKIGVK